jgi:two-component system, cell cycle response regulator DivK
MSHPFHSEPLYRIRDDARTLTEHSRDHQKQLEALAAAADRDLLAAEAELVHALEITASIDQLQSVLRVQLQRSVDAAQAVKELLFGAREQHGAAARLLSCVDAERSREAQDLEEHLRANAVLVVDDYRELRELVSQVLANAGFVVRTAANGLEAVILAHEMRPAVIVMDVTMPVLDGLQATRLIKAADATRHARVIAYTGNPTFDESLVGGLFAAVMQKPATPDVVVQTVRQVASW